MTIHDSSRRLGRLAQLLAMMALTFWIVFWNVELALTTVAGRPGVSRFSGALLALSVAAQGLLYWFVAGSGRARRGALVAVAGAALGFIWFAGGNLGLLPSPPEATGVVLCICTAAISIGLCGLLAGLDEGAGVSPMGAGTHALARECLWILGTALAMVFCVLVVDLTDAANSFVARMAYADSAPTVPADVSSAKITPRGLLEVAMVVGSLAFLQRLSRFLRGKRATSLGSPLSSPESALGALLAGIAFASVGFYATQAHGALWFLVALPLGAWWPFLSHGLASVVASAGAGPSEQARGVQPAQAKAALALAHGWGRIRGFPIIGTADLFAGALAWPRRAQDWPDMRARVAPGERSSTKGPAAMAGS